MNANLRSLKVRVEKRENDKLFILDIENDKGKLPALYIRKNEFEHMLDCMKDKIYNRYPIYDGTYTHFYPNLLKMVVFHAYTSDYKRYSNVCRDGQYTDYYIEFPFHAIVAWFESLDMIKLDDTGNYYEESLPISTIQTLTSLVAPKVEINYHSLKQTKDDLSFTICITRLKQIAENRSNGQVITIDIYNDFQDYGFSICDDKNNCIMQGGIVYHQTDNAYHTHT